MDDSVVAIPGNIILIISDQKEGIFVYVDDITPDSKPGWWRVNFQILIPTLDFKPLRTLWILDDQQIRGQEFTMGGIKHQLQKTDLKLSHSPPKLTTKPSEFETKKHKRDIPPYLKLVE
jgi:hypothetical protein